MWRETNPASQIRPAGRPGPGWASWPRFGPSYGQVGPDWASRPRLGQRKGDWRWIEETFGVILPRVPFRKMGVPPTTNGESQFLESGRTSCLVRADHLSECLFASMAADCCSCPDRISSSRALSQQHLRKTCSQRDMYPVNQLASKAVRNRKAERHVAS